MSREIEVALLGSLIISPSLFENTDVRDTDFSPGRFRLAFRMASQLWKETRAVDQVILADRMGPDNGGIGFVTELLLGNLKLSPEVFQSRLIELRSQQTSKEIVEVSQRLAAQHLKTGAFDNDGLSNLASLIEKQRTLRLSRGSGEPDTALPRSPYNAIQTKFSECDPEPVKWMMKDRIPLGMVTVFIGNPGEGKTFIAVELASRLSKGDPLPGCPQALVSGSTVFVSAENALNFILVPRAIACGADRSRLIHMPTVQNELKEVFIFDVTKHIPALEQEIRKNPDIRLVVVDPMVSHLGSKTDSFNQVEIRHAMDGLSSLAEKTGVAIIGIMHMNKSQATDVIFRASGSVQFMAAAKAAFLIAGDTYDPTGKRKLFMPVKSNLSPDRSSLAFRIEPFTITHNEKAIETGRVVFEQASFQVDVMDIMNPENRQEKTLVGQAIDFLKGALKDGPKFAQDLERQATELGISESTYKKARGKLGIIAKKSGMVGGWLCYLPEQYQGFKTG